MLRLFRKHRNKMPLYPYNCENQNCTDYGREVCFFKPVKDSSGIEKCPNCNEVMARTFSIYTPKEFQGYYDEQYKTQVSSRSQEKRLMKQNGHIFSRDAFGSKYDRQKKEAKWKINHGYSLQGAKGKKERCQK